MKKIEFIKFNRSYTKILVVSSTRKEKALILWKVDKKK